MSVLSAFCIDLDLIDTVHRLGDLSTPNFVSRHRTFAVAGRPGRPLADRARTVIVARVPRATCGTVTLVPRARRSSRRPSDSATRTSAPRPCQDATMRVPERWTFRLRTAAGRFGAGAR